MRTRDQGEHYENSTNDRVFCPAQSTWEGVLKAFSGNAFFNAGSHAVSHDPSVV